MCDAHPRFRRAAWIVRPLALIPLLLGGCGRDARLAGKTIRDPRVGPVSAYGKILDEKSSPQDVVITLLRAIEADYAAGDDLAAREKALDVQFDLSAPAYMKAHLRGSAHLSERRRLEEYNALVRHWAPTLGHYRHHFTADEAALADRMVTVQGAADPDGGPPRASVLINLEPPPPAEGEVPTGPVVARVELVKENGFWRIAHVGFERSMRDWRETPLARAGGRAPVRPKPTPAGTPAPAESTAPQPPAPGDSGS
jgi:hypothetical protein